MSVALGELTRGGELESAHYGNAVFMDSEGRVLAKAGDEAKRTYWRSSAKPIQAFLPIITGAVDRFGITERELAVICSSHFGEDMHVEAVRSMLAKAGIPESAISTGTHLPFDKASAEALIRASKKPTPLHHNCSGKHTGMLITCKQMGWPMEDYHLPDHPVQVAAHELVSELSGIPKAEIPIGVEGCSVSSFYLPLWAMGYIYAKLSDPGTLPEKYRMAAARVTAAMMANPEMVAGTYGFASILMKAHKGRIFAKNGAEGVFCLGLSGKGIGFAMKIDDGSDRAYHTAVTSALQQYGVMPDEGIEMNPVKPVKNNKGNLVGEIRPGFTLQPVAERLVHR